MKDLFCKWEELELQVESKKSYTPIFINVFSTPIVDLFIQNSLNSDYAIIIHINDNSNLEINREISGIKVKTYINEAVDKEKQSIIIENLDKDLTSIFKAFSATLVENLDEQLQYKEIGIIINETINGYKSYFSKTKESLGEMEQQGLFGELSYLKEELENGNEKALDCWEGIYKNKHDFVFDDKSVEIKTTRNQTRLNILISNENQLDNTFVNELNLVVYRLEKVNIGKTIIDLYNDILNLISQNKINQFKSKLVKAGIDFENIDNLLKFRRIQKYVFAVNEKFPKIDKTQCGDRIFEVKYHVSLDGINTIKEEKYND